MALPPAKPSAPPMYDLTLITLDLRNLGPQVLTITVGASIITSVLIVIDASALDATGEAERATQVRFDSNFRLA